MRGTSLSEPIIIKVNRLPGSEDVPLPSKMSAGAAGFDLCAAVPDDLTPRARRYPIDSLRIRHGDPARL